MVSEPSEGSEEEGRPATANPYTGPATHGLAATKAPYKGATDCGQGQSAKEADAAWKGSRPPTRASLAGMIGWGQPIWEVAVRGHTRLQRGAYKGGRL
ncbi:hypothetical protein GW17_00037859 [Ensete ventricosum]|nr:hypothetical protein GW17_00037859 [Ensete ventricosum]